MLTLIIIGAGAIALGAFASADRPDRPAQPPGPPSNPLVAPWSGPYGGVPPWDQAKPELFPGAFEAALAEQRAEIDAIASDPAAPTFENTIAAMERAGQTLRSRRPAVRRDAAEHQHAGVSRRSTASGSRSWRRPRTRSPSTRRSSSASRRCTGPWPSVDADAGAEAPGGADLRQLRAPRRHGWTTRRRRGCRRSTRSWRRCSPSSARRCWPTRTPGPCSSARPISPGCRPRSSRPRRLPPTSARLTGKWAIVNTRSSVDPFLTFSTRRDLREQVWKKFKSRGDNGDANDTKATHREDREAARRARDAARLREPCALAHVGHDGRAIRRRRRR